MRWGRGTLAAFALFASACSVPARSTDDAAPGRPPVTRAPPDPRDGATPGPTDDGKKAAPESPVPAITAVPPDAASPAAPEATKDPSEDAASRNAVLTVDAGTGAAIPGASVAFLAVGDDVPPDVQKAMEAEDEPYVVVARFGRVLTADANGRTALPRFEGTAIVAARSGDLYADEWIPARRAEIRLALHRRCAVEVRVEDAAGRPAEGVRVLLVDVCDGGRLPCGWQTTRGATATVRFSDVAFASDLSESERGVTVALPFASPPYRRVHPGEAPASPVRLVLPASGSVRCELVDAGGTRVRESGRARLRVPRERGRRSHVRDEGRFDDAVAEFVEGEAAFPWVGVGCTLEVEVPSLDGSRATVVQRIAGPVSAGQEVRVRITVGDSRPVVTGRLLDGAGRAMADVGLFAGVVDAGNPSLDPGDIPMTCKSTTDATGRFRFALDRSPGASPSAQLHVGRVRTGPGGSWGLRTVALVPLPAVLPAAETDVGDVTFRATALLVAGTVVDTAGAPVPDVTVGAMRTAKHGVRAPVKDVSTVTTGPDGRFRLEGDPAGGRVEVGVECDGWYRESEATFAPGTEDARLVLARAGGLAGSVRLPAGMQTHEVRVLVQGDPQRNGDLGYRFHEDGRSVLVRAGGKFEVLTLRPGRARVVVRLGHDRSDAVLTLDDVVIEAGAVTRDPRLQEFDPTGARTKVTVKVTDPRGLPVTGARVHFPADAEASHWKAVVTSSDGVATAPLVRVPSPLIVTCDGRRSAVLREVSADAAVVLEDGTPTPVRVRLADGVQLPAPPSALTVSLVWAEGAASRDAYARSDPRDVGGGSFESAGVVTFQVMDAGTYRVRLGLSKALPGGGRAGYAFPTRPETVLVTIPGGGEPVEVTVDFDPKDLADRSRR